MDLSGRVFVVTGSASGLGEGTARMLVANGAKVVLADIADLRGQAVATELGAGAIFVRTDVTDAGSARACIDRALSAFGPLHGLINCAGMVHGEKVVGKQPHRLETFAKVLEVNLLGSFNMTRVAAEAIAKGPADATGERGVIVFTASIAAFDGQIGQAAYAASKGGVVAMTLPLARELAASGIRVVTIAPGVFETPMIAGLPPAARDSLELVVPFPPRLGRPEEFAGLVKQIIENQMLNGEVIRLDGALRMPPRWKT